jgi:hypothetical protein
MEKTKNPVAISAPQGLSGKAGLDGQDIASAVEEAGFSIDSIKETDKKTIVTIIKTEAPAKS